MPAAAGTGSEPVWSPLPPQACPGRWELGWDYPVAASLRTHSLLFSVVCLYSILSVAFSPLSRKREIGLIATYVHACGCVSYLLMGNAWLPFLHTHDGWPVLIVRSLEWCVSVPLFLRMLAQLVADRGATAAYVDDALRRDQRRQVLALLLGTVVGPFLLPHPIAWLCFLLACALQAQVLWRIHLLLTAVRATVRDARDRALLAGLHVMTLGLCVYPVVWWLGTLTHAISPESEALAFAWLDIGSKFAFTSVLCNLTTMTHDLEMVDSAAQFWKFIRVIELPVFAISKERRVVFWNEPMAELTQMNPRAVLHRKVEDLVDIFPEETRASLTHMAVAGATSLLGGTGAGITSSGGAGEGGKQDVRYLVPLLAGGRKGQVVTATFSVLANHLEEVDIPRVVFVGSHPAETSGIAAAYDPYAFDHHQQQRKQQHGRRAGGGGWVSPSAESEESYSSSSSSQSAAAAAHTRHRHRRRQGEEGRGHGASVGGAPADDVYGDGEGGSAAVESTAFVQLAYCLHSGAVSGGGGKGGGGGGISDGPDDGGREKWE